jgi:transglutaminase-like putative cysteine protease
MSARPMQHVPGLPDTTSGYLEPTRLLDSEHPTVRAFVAKAIGNADSDREKAVRLFYAVRDQIRYDPYRISFTADDYIASRVIEAGHGWCVSKAGLLATCARAVGIASAVGLADVVNHLNTEKLRARMGGVDIFYDHGYTAMLIDGQWVKAVPAFNIELCTRFGVHPTDFDGTHDALYQEHDTSGRLHMQYLADHGTWSDLPIEQVFHDMRTKYPGIYDKQADAAARDESRFEDDAPL